MLRDRIGELDELTLTIPELVDEFACLVVEKSEQEYFASISRRLVGDAVSQHFQVRCWAAWVRENFAVHAVQNMIRGEPSVVNHDVDETVLRSASGASPSTSRLSARQVSN